MSEWQKAANDGLLRLVEKNRHTVDENVRRLKAMHQTYFQENAHFYDESETRWINHYLDSVIYKYYLVMISVEQLQAIRHNKRSESIVTAPENNLDRLDCSDNEQLLVSFALENFLFESRAFLDLYMILVCLLLRTGFAKGYMNRERFFDEFDKVQQPPFFQKAEWVTDYIKSNVFGKHDVKSFVRKDWGELIKSLRDKIAHRDIIQPSFDSDETLIKGVLLNWPTLQGMTYQAICEMIRNGMFSLFVDVSAFPYDLKYDDFTKLGAS